MIGPGTKKAWTIAILFIRRFIVQNLSTDTQQATASVIACIIVQMKSLLKYNPLSEVVWSFQFIVEYWEWLEWWFRSLCEWNCYCTWRRLLTVWGKPTRHSQPEHSTKWGWVWDLSNKSPGLDGITYEFIKHAPIRIISAICSLYNLILHTGDFPK